MYQKNTSLIFYLEEASYSAIVLVLENIYETSHEPEALGLSKALSR